MLSCQECGRYLAAYFDHALGVKENLDLQEHLQSCPDCSDRAEAETFFRAFLREQLVAPPLSEQAKRRIIRRAVAPSTTRRRFQLPHQLLSHVRDFTVGAAVAAAVMVLVFGAFSVWPTANDITQEMMRDASMAYGAYRGKEVPMEVVSTDDRQVTQWFNTRMGYELPRFCINDQSTQLVGGRLCRLLNRKSAALKYQRNGSEFLVFAFKDDNLSLPIKQTVQTKAGAMHIRQIDGRLVAVWQRNGITYSMVGDVDRDSLLNVAATVDYR